MSYHNKGYKYIQCYNLVCDEYGEYVHKDVYDSRDFTKRDLYGECVNEFSALSEPAYEDAYALMY